MMPNKLVIISFDAMVYEDLELLCDKPCFNLLLSQGSQIKRMRTIYPSLTYPSHVSILTGALPGKHGIVNNEPSVPGNLKCDWYWFHEPVKVPDLHDVAKAAGLTTASVFWPVTGAHPSVDYLLAEYWAQGKNDTLEKAYKRAGTSDSLFDEVIRDLIPKLDSWESPFTDEGKTLCACEIIRRYQPDLLTLHLGQIDYYRHRYGIFNDKVSEGVEKSEHYLEMIFNACKDAGIFDYTNFVIVSDHGQINYSRRMNLNLLFVNEGLIRLDSSGNIADWDVWAKSANFSAQIYLNDKTNSALHEKVNSLLQRWCKDGDMGIGRVYSAEEASREEGLFGDFSFVIESDDETLFFSDWREPLFSEARPIADGYLRASHGHHPDKGPQPIFVAMGPDIRKGVVLEHGRVIDEAPTFATLLGTSLPYADGKIINEILVHT